MIKRWKLQKIAARVDGENQYSAAVTDEESRRYEQFVETLHNQVQTLPQAPTLADESMPAFLSGIQEGLEEPAFGRGRLWATASALTAALILILSLFVIFSSGPEPVRATEVESCSTELDGVTLQTFDNRDGVSTVWVTMPESDLW
ncbi:MAG: hypothetical protein GX130_12625 [Candidatus Hydrogenedens sp.]|jgi:hypothetical protein|nr:hypothetical protein [Candidatus Hydrogenedens sp.]